MLENNTRLQIGPLTFTHQVQKINIQERKGVQVLEATRSKKNFVVDSGDSAAKAQIRLLFVGLDEINGIIKPLPGLDEAYGIPLVPDISNGLQDINNGLDSLTSLFRAASNNSSLSSTLARTQETTRRIIDGVPVGSFSTTPSIDLLRLGVNAAANSFSELTSSLDQRISSFNTSVDQYTLPARRDIKAKKFEIPMGLRSLIALFRCCPIVTLNNKYISSSWKKADKIYDKTNYEKLKNYLADLTSINRNLEKMILDKNGIRNQEYLNQLYVEQLEKEGQGSIGPLSTEQTIRANDSFTTTYAALLANKELVTKLNSQLAQYKDTITPDQSLDFLRGATFADYHFGSVQFPDNFLQQNVVYSDNVSVALESLELENVPDIPKAIQATLTIARIDTAPYTEGNELQYLGINGLEDSKDNPNDAYWLKLWIHRLLENNSIPQLTDSDFYSVDFKWYGKTAISTDLSPADPENSFSVSVTSDTDTYPKNSALLISENCSIRHKFAYNKIIGKIFPTAAHMGSTARFLSLDIVFNNQQGYEVYNKFCKFKYTSDEINKERERFDRITGWEIQTPISTLLSSSYFKTISSNPTKSGPHNGVYVPISIITENGSEPHMINCRIDLIENNIDFYSDNEIVLESGGTEYSSLEKYYNNLLEAELRFRVLLNKDKKKTVDLIIGNNPTNSESTDYSAYFTFWPIEKGLLLIKEESGFGVLNIDSLRATILKLDDPKYGGTGLLKEALYESELITGNYIANRRPGFFDTVRENVDLGVSAFFGDEGEDNPDIKPIYSQIESIVERIFTIPANFPEGTTIQKSFIKQIARYLTVGFTGDRTAAVALLFNNSSTGEAIKLMSTSNLSFSEGFKKALLDTLVERKPKPSKLPYIYSTDGVYAGFYKLLLAYDLDKDKVTDPNQLRKDLSNDIVKKNTNRGNQSLFPDLLLPTYTELYQQRWTEFAPTIEDLGIVIPQDPTAMPDRSQLLAVSETDFVSPACWFYIKRNKKNLKQSLSNTIKAAQDASPVLSLSVPFNTHDIQIIKDKLKILRSNINTSERYKKAESSLHEIIRDAFLRYKESNPSGFREDVVTVLTAGDKFSKRYLSGGAETIHLQERNNGSYAVPRDINIPGIGAEIYRVIKEDNFKLLEEQNFNLLDPSVEATYVTPLNKQAVFLRNSRNQTEACLKSSLDQIGDDHTSPERMFPSIKIYLIDRRGTDLIADDTLFNVNSIISVDITMDKDDAPVAVIKLADPLYFLQSSYFDQKNIVYTEGSKEEKPKIDRVFNSLRQADKDSFLKRYKIAQGRAVQIRMGYSSMAYNLPIVFTGRIAEISPGDELVLVCQGWKAELVSRQVNFYNDDTKNWGARDLAIQAITYANPDGFGDVYPEADAQFILRNMDPTEVELALDNIRQNRSNIDLEGVGSRTFKEGVANWFSSYFTTSSNDKRNIGLDTRLKNIWYPDTQLYTNILGLRSSFNVMPSWLNDSWIVPVQPAWDVLKEAARHAWNCVVDVVPYDGQATIFMGHPDQPYYYTRGDAFSRKTFRQQYKKNTEKLNETIIDLFNDFLESEYYSSEQGNSKVNFIVSPEEAENYINQSIKSALSSPRSVSAGTGGVSVDLRTTDQIAADAQRNAKQFTILESKDFSTFVSFFKRGIAANGYLGSSLKTFNSSSLPSSKLQEVITSGISSKLPVYLLAYFYGIPVNKIVTQWPTINNDLPRILLNIDDTLQNPEVKTRVESLTLVSSFLVGPELQNLIKLINNRIVYYNTNLNNRSLGKVQILEGIKEANIFILDEVLPILEKNKKYIGYGEATLSEIKKQVKDALDEARSVSLRVIVSESYLTNRNNLTPEINRLQQILLTIDSLFDKRVPEGRRQFIESVISKIGLSSTSWQLLGINTGNFILDYLPIFKAFVFYFCSFILENQPNNLKELTEAVSNYDKTTLPPNMKVFRVHHFADDTHNILKNNIVASTKEMWNTVVIEHPSPGTANDAVEDKDVFRTGTLSAGINWVYWPKQEITGVLGLQFHPGLTLANKKIKVFTELNCQTTDLAAKLACTHLADGIKKMYRGNLLLLGKHIKPHDRIILADSYTKMVGPVEVESVVHHWNADQGWITNIIPNAVCDANPASGVLQTAAMEATFQSVFNVIDFAADLFTYATIVATLGGATPLAVGSFSVKKGLKTALGSLLSPRSFPERIVRAWSLKSKRFAKGITNDWRKGSRIGLLKSLYREVGGPVNALLANEVARGAAIYGPSLWFKHTAISSYLEIGDKAEQLPVIFTPLIFNGNPFTAGLETEDSVWAIGAFNSYYSMKELQAGASRVLEDFINYISE